MRYVSYPHTRKYSTVMCASPDKATTANSFIVSAPVDWTMMGAAHVETGQPGWKPRVAVERLAETLKGRQTCRRGAVTDNIHATQ